MWLYLGLFVLGVIIGCIVMALLSRSKAVGDLCIATIDDTEVPYLALKKSTDLETIKQKKFVKLKVVNLVDRSQK